MVTVASGVCRKARKIYPGRLVCFFSVDTAGTLAHRLVGLENNGSAISQHEALWNSPHHSSIGCSLACGLRTAWAEGKQFADKGEKSFTKNLGIGKDCSQNSVRRISCIRLLVWISLAYSLWGYPYKEAKTVMVFYSSEDFKCNPFKQIVIHFYPTSVNISHSVKVNVGHKGTTTTKILKRNAGAN